MTLKEYRRKRRFDVTGEPRGKHPAAKGRHFVVQKHDATRLHYDFRLEHEGVLWSWALPKGPSLDPTEKRLAVHVEDHPLEYRRFEGTIPAGQYGGGTVMVWDRGSWEPHDDPAAAYRAGKLSFTLHGEKLQGDWTLVRMGGGRSRPGKENWLLLKSCDAAARPPAEGDVLEQAASVKTGRSLEEIAAGNSARSRAKSPRTAADKKSTTKISTRIAKKKPEAAERTRARAPKRNPSGARKEVALNELPGSRTAPFPKRPQAELALLVAQPPAGDDWLHEIKFDGYRMLCLVQGDRVRFVSRNGQDWTAKFPGLVAAATRLKSEDAVIDGEVVVLDEHGASRFQLLQNALGDKGARVPLLYYAFDVLYCDGFDVSRVPLEDRKEILRRLIPASLAKAIRYSDHVVGRGEKLHAEARRRDLEGIISKRRASAYLPGRSGDWLKSKCKQQQEFVVAGYTDPGGSRAKFGSLLLGYFDQEKLAYAGRVGTGFTQQSLRDLYPQLRKLETNRSPFRVNAEYARGKGVHWLRPKLVAQIEFSNWTDDNLLRQPSFQGLRDDKPATAVRREQAAPMPRRAR